MWIHVFRFFISMSFFSTKSFFFFLTLGSSYLPSEYKFILYSFFIFMMVGWVVVMYDFVNSRLKSHLLNHVRIEGTIIYNLSPFSVACFKHSDQLMHFPMQIILPGWSINPATLCLAVFQFCMDGFSHAISFFKSRFLMQCLQQILVFELSLICYWSRVKPY